MRQVVTNREPSTYLAKTHRAARGASQEPGQQSTSQAEAAAWPPGVK